MLYKMCCSCAETKPEHAFNKDSRKSGGLKSACKDCLRKRQAEARGKNRDSFNAYKKEWRKKNIHKVRVHNLRSKIKNKYGLTIDDVHNMLSRQKYECAICGYALTWASKKIDHNHADGTVRGILCNSCNIMLGHSNDNVEILSSAIKYLEKQNPCYITPLRTEK